MDYDILPDMGRMTARLCSIGKTRCSLATIKGRRTGRPSPHLSRPANCMVSIRKPTSPTCSQSSSISGLHRASTSSCLGVGQHSVLPIASRRNHEGDFAFALNPTKKSSHRNSAIGELLTHYPPLRIRGQPAEAQTGRGAIRVGQDHWRIGAANAAWREEAGLQVHADNGCLRSHQVAQVDRSNRLNDSRLPNRQCRQRFKLADNASPLELHFQQPVRRSHSSNRRCASGLMRAIGECRRRAARRSVIIGIAAVHTKSSPSILRDGRLNEPYRSR